MRISRIAVLAILASTSLLACGGGGGGGGTKLSSIAVGPDTPTVAEGYVRQLTATATYSDGTTQDVSASATWSSAEERVASVDSAGLATGLKPGSTSISAALDGVTGSATLTVNPAPAFGCCVNAVAAGPDGTTYVGGTFSLVAAATGSWVPLDATTGRTAGAFARVNGPVYATASDGSGGWFIGGHFTAVEGVRRRFLAHIKADGSLDEAWNPDPDASVYALAVSGGTVYVGGFFWSIGSTTGSSPQPTRKYLAALRASDGTATDWDPGADDAVYALAVHGDLVYAGGAFHSVGAVAHPTRNHLAALRISDGTATDWNPSADDDVQALAVKVNEDSSVTLYAGGFFKAIGAVSTGAQPTRNHLAALKASDGTVTSWDPGADDVVFALVVKGGIVYAGGWFQNIGRQPRPYLAALDASAGTATSWSPSPDSAVYALAVSGGTVYAGGEFSSIGSQLPRPGRKSLAAIDATDASATAWAPNMGGQVYALGVSGSTVYAGGDLVGLDPQQRNRLAAVDRSGTLLPWNPAADAEVSALAVSGSVVYAGGYFAHVGAVDAAASPPTRTYLAALDATDGTATGWNPRPDGSVSALVVSGDTLYAAGSFSHIGAVEGASSQPARKYLAALSTSDGRATDWDPSPDGSVVALRVNGSTVLVGGYFSKIGAVAGGSLPPTRDYLAALDASTGAATDWNPNPDAPVLTLATSGTTVYAGGYFSRIGATTGGSPQPTRSFLAALDASTGAATDWNPNPNAPALTLATRGTTVVVSGYFTTIGAVDGASTQPTKRYLAAVDATTGSATEWDAGATGYMNALTTNRGTMYAGGSYGTVCSSGYGSFVPLRF